MRLRPPPPPSFVGSRRRRGGGSGGETIKLRIVPFYMKRAGGTDATIMPHCLKLNFARTLRIRIFLFRPTQRDRRINFNSNIDPR